MTSTSRSAPDSFRNPSGGRSQCYLGNGMVISSDGVPERTRGSPQGWRGDCGSDCISPTEPTFCCCLTSWSISAREEAAGDQARSERRPEGSVRRMRTRYARFGLRMTDLMADDLADRSGAPGAVASSRICAESARASHRSFWLQETVAACEEVSAPSSRPISVMFRWRSTRRSIEGKSVLVRGCTGHTSRRRPWHLPLRHEFELDVGRSLDRNRGATDANRRRHRHSQGLHDASR